MEDDADDRQFSEDASTYQNSSGSACLREFSAASEYFLWQSAQEANEKTEKYLKSVISKTTFVGLIFLSIIAALPILISKVPNISSSVTLGGTGLLIVVGVALETYKQLESSVVSRSYTGSRKKRRR